MKQLILISIAFVLGVMTGLYFKPNIEEEVNEYMTNHSDWVEYKNKHDEKPWE